MGTLKLECFGFYVGDVIMGVGLCIFSQGHQSWVPTPRVNFWLKLLVETML